jgi:hypothetical protein
MKDKIYKHTNKRDYKLNMQYEELGNHFHQFNSMHVESNTKKDKVERELVEADEKGREKQGHKFPKTKRNDGFLNS